MPLLDLLFGLAWHALIHEHDDYAVVKLHASF